MKEERTYIYHAPPQKYLSSLEKKKKIKHTMVAVMMGKRKSRDNLGIEKLRPFLCKNLD